jgi:hypothetical protein
MAFTEEIERLNLGDDTVLVLEAETLSDASTCYNVLILGDCGRVKVKIDAVSMHAALVLFNNLSSTRLTSGIEVDSIH